jgi:hypothetical protein
MVANGAGLNSVFLTDPRGTLIRTYPVAPGVVGRNFAFRDWCRGLAAHGGPYVSTAYQTALPGHPLVIAVSDYIRGADGQPVGVLAAIISLRAIRDFSANIAKAQGITLTVTDRAGTLLSAGGTQGQVSMAADPRVAAALHGRSGLLNYTAPQAGGMHHGTQLSAYTAGGGVPVDRDGIGLAASGVRRVGPAADHRSDDHRAAGTDPRPGRRHAGPRRP